MSIKLTHNAVSLKDETTQKFLPIGIFASGSDKSIKEIKDFADEKKAEAVDTITPLLSEMNEKQSEITELIATIPDDYNELNRLVKEEIIKVNEEPSDYTRIQFETSSDEVELVTIDEFNEVMSNITKGDTLTSANADFAEVGEWSDGNPSNEDRLCYFVCVSKTESGITMTKANSNSDVRGVTIENPAFSANASLDKYDENGKLLPKYNYVAFAGFATVIDNGTCTVNERCMPDDNGCAVPSTNNMGYQVIERVDDNKVLIMVEPNADMLNRIKTDITELQEDNGNTIDVTLDKSTYVMTISLKNADGEVLSSKSVDFPMETAFVNADYDKVNKKMIFTLESGVTVEVPLGNLVEGLVSQVDFDLLKEDMETIEGNVAQNTQDIEELKNGGAKITVDSELSETSENPVQNKIITEALNSATQRIDDLEQSGVKITVDSELSNTSENPVQNKVITEILDTVVISDNTIDDESAIKEPFLSYVMESDLPNLVSDLYDNTKTYVVGDYCIKDNSLYKCIVDITEAEEFNEEKWQVTNIDEIISNAIFMKEPIEDNSVIPDSSTKYIMESDLNNVVSDITQITEFYADMSNLNGISITEYVKNFNIRAFVIGKTIHCTGSIMFEKVGVNVNLLENLPFSFKHVNRVPTSTWLTKAQAILYVGSGNVISGAFGEIQNDIEYAFNFTALLN